MPSLAPRVDRLPLLPVLASLFFFSGASALIYQILWLRLLGLVFGVTVHAASTVLASFMAGLAVGSLAAGYLAARARRPLVWFGTAEALVAVSALLTPTGLRVLQEVYASIHPSLPESIALLTGVRFAIAFGVLLIPSALMGATLPLIVRSSLSRAAGIGTRFGVLYAANTAGAIVGTLAAGLWLIPALGIRGTFVVAAATNLLVAAVAIGAGWRSPVEAGTASVATGSEAVGGDRVRRTVLLVFGVSGFTALALEVVWFRVNVLVLRPTVYAYAVMLATVLAGIATGSALAAPWLKRARDWLVPLAVLEFLIAASALLTFAGLAVAPALIPRAERVLGFLPQYLIPLIVTSILTIFPSMLLMGAAFPIGLHVWTGGAEPSVAARRIGVFYAINVCGSIAGSVTAGFILLPAAGSRNTVLLLAAITGCCALALLGVARGPVPRRLVLAAVGVALLVLAPVPDPFRVFLAQRFPDWPIVWQEEGVQTTVSVHRVGSQRAMYLDGLHQASTAGSMSRTHWRIGHLGLMLHPQAADVLVVGLGGGATAGAVSRYPFARTHIVELSSAVVRGAAYFTDINYGVLTRPNVTLSVDDGRSHLALSGRKYDVITADIIQPVHAGAANVYAAEYFRLVRSALRPGGLAVQWVFGTDAEYRMIMRTFLSVFPHATLWADGSVMVAGPGPLKVSGADVAWKLNVPQIAAALNDAGIGSTADLLALYTAGPEAMRRFAGPGPTLTDDRPVLEYFLSLPREPLNLQGLTGRVSEIVGQ